MTRYRDDIAYGVEPGRSESPPEAALAREQGARDSKRKVNDLQAERLTIVMALVGQKSKDDGMLDAVAALIREEIREEDVGATLMVRRRVVDESTCVDQGRRTLMRRMRQDCEEGEVFDEVKAGRLVEEVYGLVELKLSEGEGQIVEGSKRE